MAREIMRAMLDEIERLETALFLAEAEVIRLKNPPVPFPEPKPVAAAPKRGRKPAAQAVAPEQGMPEPGLFPPD